MSLILDALRKSEAERRRGQMPDLHAELPPPVRATVPSRRRWPAWFAAIAAVLAIALGGSLWMSRKAPAPDAPAGVAKTEPVATSPVAPLPSRSSMPVAAPPRAAAMATSPTEATPPVVDTAQAGSPALARVPSTAMPAAPAASSLREPPATQAEPETGRYAGAISRAAPTPPAAPVTAVAAEAAPPLPVPATGSSVRLADLSPGEREQLPALKISMHMWGPTAAQRFAIIDGTRVGQGDRVGDAVVEEILADGVVLNWHGRRLSLPLR